jgi:hypothetical protein
MLIYIRLFAHLKTLKLHYQIQSNSYGVSLKISFNYANSKYNKLLNTKI